MNIKMSRRTKDTRRVYFVICCTPLCIIGRLASFIIFPKFRKDTLFCLKGFRPVSTTTVWKKYPCRWYWPSIFCRLQRKCRQRIKFVSPMSTTSAKSCSLVFTTQANMHFRQAFRACICFHLSYLPKVFLTPPSAHIVNIDLNMMQFTCR